jgi:hypothetical protein
MDVCYFGDYPKDIECVYHEMEGYNDGWSVDFVCECTHPIAKIEFHRKSCFNEVVMQPMIECPYFKLKE